MRLPWKWVQHLHWISSTSIHNCTRSTVRPVHPAAKVRFKHRATLRRRISDEVVSGRIFDCECCGGKEMAARHGCWALYQFMVNMYNKPKSGTIISPYFRTLSPFKSLWFFLFLSCLCLLPQGWSALHEHALSRSRHKSLKSFAKARNNTQQHPTPHATSVLPVPVTKQLLSWRMLKARRNLISGN